MSLMAKEKSFITNKNLIRLISVGYSEEWLRIITKNSYVVNQLKLNGLNINEIFRNIEMLKTYNVMISDGAINACINPNVNIAPIGSDSGVMQIIDSALNNTYNPFNNKIVIERDNKKQISRFYKLRSLIYYKLLDGKIIIDTYALANKVELLVSYKTKTDKVHGPFIRWVFSEKNNYQFNKVYYDKFDTTDPLIIGAMFNTVIKYLEHFFVFESDINLRSYCYLTDMDFVYSCKVPKHEWNNEPYSLGRNLCNSISIACMNK